MAQILRKSSRIRLRGFVSTMYYGAHEKFYAGWEAEIENEEKSRCEWGTESNPECGMRGRTFDDGHVLFC